MLVHSWRFFGFGLRLVDLVAGCTSATTYNYKNKSNQPDVTIFKNPL